MSDSKEINPHDLIHVEGDLHLSKKSSRHDMLTLRFEVVCGIELGVELMTSAGEIAYDNISRLAIIVEGGAEIEDVVFHLEKTLHSLKEQLAKRTEIE